MEGYEKYDILFEAADISYLANEDVVTYSASRRKLEDDREGMLYYGEQEWQKGMKEGRKEGEQNIIRKLLQSGLSLEDLAARLNCSPDDMTPLLQ